ncbi:MAG: 23S rRNA (uracil(1939)-C(5))-methyltransferase RlmD [Parachlamydia sp.]|nr:23S rRNA (uracil(1939)-C(5))-methyltransferase RlmD [Parachlamydia sp.]
MTKSPKKRTTVQIQSFSKQGNGLGTFLKGDGASATAEVPFTLPGEQAKALLIRKRGGIYSGLLEEVETPSPERIAPRCIHFGTCGGCRWQHMPYELQLAQKEAGIRHAFARLLTPNVDVKPIVPCDPPWQYRNKMEFTFSSDAAGNRYLGLIMDSSRGKVINLTECHLVNPWFIEALTVVRSWWADSGLLAYRPSHDAGSLRTLTLREGMRTGDRMAILTVSGNPDFALKRPQLDSLVATLRQAVEPKDPACTLAIFLRIHQIAKGMPTNFYEMQLYGPDFIKEELQVACDVALPSAPLKFKISPGAFFQPNTFQAERLYSLALQLADIPKGSVVYDLYCGTGTLGIAASQLASQVIGIELSLESSLDAKTNAQMNGCENVTILPGNVPDVLAKIRQEKSHPLPDLVIVDPPRAGLGPDALRHLAELSAPKILYVSCNPVTQSADIQVLCEAGYHLTLLQPVDQFPHTPHVENIAVLIR